jgi:DNA-binding NarL/FixJ family response regulator
MTVLLTAAHTTDGRADTCVRRVSTPSSYASRLARPLAAGTSVGSGRTCTADVARVLVVDGRQLAAESLCAALRRRELHVALPPATDSDAILTAVASRHYDVVIVGVPAGQARDSAALIEQLTACGARVIALTEGSADTTFDAARCFEAGAEGVAFTSEPLAALTSMIGRAVDGLPLVGVAHRTQAIIDLRDRERADQSRHARFTSLSHRESDVLRMIADGQSAAAIAGAHFVSVATVRTQIRSILQKLDVNTQVGAIALVRTLGWS